MKTGDGFERCEWNPSENRAACVWPDGRHEGCQNEALVSVGSNGMWHLCACCAILPRFKRFRTRTPLPIRGAR